MHAEQAYLFRHALVRDAAYALQVPSERATLHEHALDILELEPDTQGGLAADLADHAREAGNRHAHKELHYLKLAAIHAEQTFNNVLQIELGQRIAVHPQCSDETAAEQLRATGIALIHQGRAPEAEPFIAQAIARAGRTGNRMLQLAVRRTQLDCFKVTGRRAESDAGLPPLVDELRELGDSLELCQAELDLASRHAPDLTQEQRLAGLRRALEVARRIGNPTHEAESHGHLGFELNRSGRTAEAEQSVQRGLALCCGPATLRVEASLMNTLAVICVESDRIDEAAGHYRRALELSRISGRLHSEAIILRNLANLEYFFGGDLHAADTYYKESRNFFLEGGDHENAATACRMLGSVASAQGDASRALTHFEDAIQHAKRSGDRVTAAESERFSAQVRAMIDPEYADFGLLVRVIGVMAKEANRARAVGPLTDLASALFRKGMLGATSRAFGIAARAGEGGAPTAVWPMLARRLEFEALTGTDPDPTGPLAKLTEVMGPQATPHHHISNVLGPRFLLELGAAMGPSGLLHLRPDWQGLAVPRATLEYIQELLQGPAGQYATARATHDECKAAFEEAEHSVRECRPAVLFRGRRPSFFTSQCRAALIDQVRNDRSSLHADIQRSNPVLFAKMQGEAPDWQATDLQGGELRALESELFAPGTI